MTYNVAESSWGEEELAAIHRVVDSGRFTMGEQVRRFEEAFAAKIGMKHAIMVNSGSSANLIGVAALAFKGERPLRPGDEAIVPAISWATTYHPLQQYGLRCRFVDIELDTLNMDTSRLAAALTPRTRIVVAVSILGNPAALDRIRAFCDAHGLYMLEDNCESMGARVAGRLCGTWGDVTTHSLFFSHHISTMEGGVVTTDDDELAHLSRSLRAHGWTRDLPRDSPIYEPRDDDFFEAYRFILPGYNVRPLELSGAVGLEQLRKVDRFIEIRRANGRFFTDLFAGDERFIIQRENGESSWFSFTVILNPTKGVDRERVMAGLKDAGIQFRIITGGCFLRHDVIKYFDHDVVGSIDNANLAHDRGFFVGNFPRDARAEIEHFYKVITRLSN